MNHWSIHPTILTEIIRLPRDFLFRPLWGGGGLYTQMFFLFGKFWPIDIFIVESWGVSLESSSSVEYGIKKDFLIFVFYRELSRFKLLRKVESIPFLFTFSWILTKISSIFLNFFQKSAADFFWRQKNIDYLYLFLIAALIFSAGYYSAPIFFTSSNFFSLYLFAAFSTFCVKSFLLLWTSFTLLSFCSKSF